MVNSNSMWKFTAVLVEIQLSRLGGGGGGLGGQWRGQYTIDMKRA